MSVDALLLPLLTCSAMSLVAAIGLLFVTENARVINLRVKKTAEAALRGLQKSQKSAIQKIKKIQSRNTGGKDQNVPPASDDDAVDTACTKESKERSGDLCGEHGNAVKKDPCQFENENDRQAEYFHHSKKCLHVSVPPHSFA